MKILKLKAHNYRNITHLEQDFDPAGAVITGPNGCGKTNLLEAIAFFAFGKSFRNSADNDCIAFKQQFFRLEAIFADGKNKHRLEAAADNKGGKFIKMDAAPIERISNLFGLVKVVYLNPADIAIVSGSGGNRRRFLDLAVTQHNPTYMFNLRNYLGILRQRNALLKTTYDQAEKQAWDERFVQAATQIIMDRLHYLSVFLPEFEDYYRKISGGKELATAAYKLNWESAEFSPGLLAERLAKDEKREQAYGYTLSGPHLDDLSIELSGHKARDFASQGQKRCLSLAARLAQAKLADAPKPILMFDDVLAEIDLTRTRAVLNLLPADCQVFIAQPRHADWLPAHLPVINLQSS